MLELISSIVVFSTLNTKGSHIYYTCFICIPRHVLLSRYNGVCNKM